MVPTPTQSLPATPTSAPPAQTSGWSFMNVQVYPDEFLEGVVLYGEAINNTGSTQDLTIIRATLYDAQGQLVAGSDDVIDYWPINIVPAGARLPFELLVPEVETVADFELNVEAQPGSQTPQQNFEILDLSQQQDEFGFCLAGQVRNLGNPLQEYLIVMAVLYDSQDHVIKFGEYYAPDPTLVLGDQLGEFDICIDSIQGEIARHEVRAWGE